MIRPKFGTDGVRGEANTQITPDFAVQLGRAAAPVLGSKRVLIGRDTRRSGPMLEAALAAGFASAGVDVELLGVVPTPAIALLGQLDGVAAAAITASHNPFPDNGIKLFAPGGRKLPDEVEARIEAALDAGDDGTGRPIGAGLGTITSNHGEAHRYVDNLVGQVGAGSLGGVRIVLDCANGATSELAAEIFTRSGADVTTIGATPDGVNINLECGATHPAALARAVVDTGADLGLAFDGDGDRLIAVGADGAVVDGDRIIALLAVDLRDRGELRDDTVVVTVMSNLGFHRAMRDAAINVATTAVGDRYVLEALEGRHWSLGGEQSGHIIIRDRAPTGDGMLSGLLLCDLLRRSGRSLADLATGAMTVYPQILQNVRVTQRHPDVADLIADDIAAVAAELGDDGRVLVRPSGTEPLIRVMVEAGDPMSAQSAVDRLVSVITSKLG